MLLSITKPKRHQKEDTCLTLLPFFQDFFGSILLSYPKIYENVAVNFNVTPSMNVTRGNSTDFLFRCSTAVDSHEKDRLPFDSIKACSGCLYLVVSKGNIAGAAVPDATRV